MPFLSEFAGKIGVNVAILEKWAKRHKEFGQAFIRAKELQKEFLITNGLLGLYNPTFSIFIAKNITDMRDRPELKTDDDTQQQYGIVYLPRPIPLEEIIARHSASLKAGEQKALPAGKQSENGLDVDHGAVATSQKGGA
jgi:hypothetical protein